jgi:ABC-type uncharacterized transport system substrate-binding protein
VPSLNRPGDNITGVSFYGVDLAPKQLSLLHDLVPKVSSSSDSSLIKTFPMP